MFISFNLPILIIYIIISAILSHKIDYFDEVIKLTNRKVMLN
jgi:hypothetical protein